MTEDERAALIEQIARMMCETAGDDWLEGRAYWTRKASAILAIIEPAIRADERARMLAEATTNEAVVRALVTQRLYHTDLATCDPPEWPGDWDAFDRDEIMDGMRAAIRAALRSKP